MALEYTMTDYLETTAPYEEIEKCATPFEKEQKKAAMAKHAKSVGVANFLTLYKAYVTTMKQLSKGDYIENACNFEGQELELDTGSWAADDYGVYRIGYQGQEEVACSHPLMPVQRLSNIDNGMEKIRLAYKREYTWKSVIVDRELIANRNKIISLSNYGIAVTSENAKHMVNYLNDVENINYTRIPFSESVDRLGWVGNGKFSPYIGDLIFDGDDKFKTFFNSVKQKGKAEKWINLGKKIRSGTTVIPKIILAASFASALVEPCSCLCFFVHIWGGTGNGKTVALMLAASVWATPEMGAFAHTCNSTAVGQEYAASFVNSLPLILDELQMIKDKKDFDQMIYQLSEGAGKTRGDKTGGLRKTGTWRNCIMTSGEQPITTGSSGGGAINRTIEINCEEENLFEDVQEVLSIIRRNYGHAGKQFIELLNDPKVMDEAKECQQLYYKELNKKSTEKQALAASLILAADTIIGKYIFDDNGSISFEEMDEFLSTKDDVDQGKRGYSWLQDWIVQNASKFINVREIYSDYIPNSDIYGKITPSEVTIIRSVFNKACTDNGFNPTALASWLKRQKLTSTNGNRLDKPVRINGSLCRCIVVETARPVEFEPVQENIEF